METYTQNGYVAERVLTASPMELTRLLYEGALGSIDLAIEMLHANKITERGNAITKAVNIIHELRGSLNSAASPEIASRLLRLYIYIQNRLFDGHARKSEPALLEASRLLRQLYQGWLDVMKRASAESAAQQRAVIESCEIPIAVMSPYASAFDCPSSGRSWAA
jgi:flagellar protein FliS